MTLPTYSSRKLPPPAPARSIKIKEYLFSIAHLKTHLLFRPFFSVMFTMIFGDFSIFCCCYRTIRFGLWLANVCVKRIDNLPLKKNCVLRMIEANIDTFTYVLYYSMIQILSNHTWHMKFDNLVRNKNEIFP